MLQAFFNWQISKMERRLGVPLDYFRQVAKISPSAALRMARFSKLAQAGKGPRDALLVASIAGAMADDCGSCVQIGVNLARKEGLSREILSAVVNHDPARLPDSLADVYRFSEAVTLNSDEQDDLREKIRRRYGEKGVIEICMAIAMHRVYPTLKRGLGFAKSCSRVTVEV
jgi:alkylhydroperoxidase family enzyme